jgi:hypothetical protein
MGAWTEIVDYTVPSTTSSFIVNNFGSITKNDFLKAVISVTNSTVTTGHLQMFPNTTAGVNGYNTGANYTVQRIQVDSTNIVASRGSQNKALDSPGSNTNTGIIYFKVSENGKFNMFSRHNWYLTPFPLFITEYTTSHNLTFNDPITSLTFTHTTTNGIAAGTRVQIYRLDAEKVADITTTANATQVDIPNLSIGKDNEYLLVSDLSGMGTNAQIDLTVNDDVTRTNFYRQVIFGGGSTAAASRANTAFIADVVGNDKALVYSHIKLSEIGAYTSQNYVVSQYGTSSVAIVNSFISSTSEAITSITKLNVRANNTNAIGSGSRFILYKLY